MFKKNIPSEVVYVIKKLKNCGYEAYLVGGSILNIMLNINPKDWDITTSAKPEEVMSLFPKVIPSGLNYGTVTVVEGKIPIEVTTYRAESRYIGHHPQIVKFGVSLEEDLKRRDFTVNAIAYDPVNDKLVANSKVISDLSEGILPIETVGIPEDRFKEDPLRMLRAFYLMVKADMADFECKLTDAVSKTIEKHHQLIAVIAKERIREELNKIILGPRPNKYLELMYRLKILNDILPELSKTRGVEQGSFHKKDVFGHTLDVIFHVKPEISLRWTALLHDLGKVNTKTIIDNQIHFYGHAKESTLIGNTILSRLKFSKKLKDKILLLVKNHMFQIPQTKQTTRHFITKIGKDNILDLLELRRADIIASRFTDTSKIEEFKKLVTSILMEKPPFTIKDLKVNGYDVMKTLDIKPGKQVGKVLKYLFELVLNDPQLNEREKLLSYLKSMDITKLK
ncbi:MAG: hypothetical protein PWP31_1648 [Clostridia bacterium]|nr:hypothetical protein [Clostridia bacterium]